jgi:hypothetical protein
MSAQAKRNGVSVNKLATQYLAQGLERTETLSLVRREIAALIEKPFAQWRLEEEERAKSVPYRQTLTLIEGGQDEYRGVA